MATLPGKNNRYYNLIISKQLFFLLLLFLFCFCSSFIFAQEEEERIVYYQMEPLDDSLFIHIQEQLFIDPPDPKAEIIVDLRNANDQTIAIKGTLYPLLALNQETRAKIITYPFKLNLEETVNYGSVFTNVIEKIKLKNVFQPPTKFQISSSLGYINPFFQLFGGERFGWSIKKDIGLSIGVGTEYSGPLETNYCEGGFHILGFYAGAFTSIDPLLEFKDKQTHNNLMVISGIRLSYVIPIGNFFEIGFISADKFSPEKINKYTRTPSYQNTRILNPDSTIRYQAYFAEGDFINWELRYPIEILGSTRGKFYIADFLDEYHVGYTGRELALAGSVFDFRLDALVSSPVRQAQLVFDIIVQRIFDYWGFSSIAVGPGGILGTLDDGSLGFTSLFFNLRIKLGTSL